MYPRYEYRNAPFYMNLHSGPSNCPTRFHKEIEILWVKSGSIQVQIDGDEKTLFPGDVYIVFPNLFHSVKAEDSEYLLIIADSELFPAFQEAFSQKKPAEPILRKKELSPFLYTLLEEAFKAFQAENAIYRRAVMAGLINAFLGKTLSLKEFSDRKPNSALVENLMLYVYQHYTEEITLEEVAKEMGYNKFYISHVISDAFHCKFRTLVNSYKISHAKYLLSATSKTVSEISFECGFKNQSSFNRIFLKSCGTTPTDYRKDPKNSAELPRITVR